MSTTDKKNNDVKRVVCHLKRGLASRLGHLHEVRENPEEIERSGRD